MDVFCVTNEHTSTGSKCLNFIENLFIKEEDENQVGSSVHRGDTLLRSIAADQSLTVAVHRHSPSFQSNIIVRKMKALHNDIEKFIGDNDRYDGDSREHLDIVFRFFIEASRSPAHGFASFNKKELEPLYKEKPVCPFTVENTRYRLHSKLIDKINENGIARDTRKAIRFEKQKTIVLHEETQLRKSQTEFAAKYPDIFHDFFSNLKIDAVFAKYSKQHGEQVKVLDSKKKKLIQIKVKIKKTWYGVCPVCLQVYAYISLLKSDCGHSICTYCAEKSIALTPLCVLCKQQVKDFFKISIDPSTGNECQKSVTIKKPIQLLDVMHIDQH